MLTPLNPTPLQQPNPGCSATARRELCRAPAPVGCPCCPRSPSSPFSPVFHPALPPPQSTSEMLLCLRQHHRAGFVVKQDVLHQPFPAPQSLLSPHSPRHFIPLPGTERLRLAALLRERNEPSSPWQPWERAGSFPESLWSEKGPIRYSARSAHLFSQTTAGICNSRLNISRVCSDW